MCRMLFFAFVALISSSILCVYGDDQFAAVEFLETFGYLQSSPGHYNAPDNVNKAIRDFQEFFNLTATGHLDKRTVEFMKQPRCGNADVVRKRQDQEPISDVDAPLNYKTVRGCQMRETNNDEGNCYNIGPLDIPTKGWICCPQPQQTPQLKSGRRGIPRTLEECECNKNKWPKKDMTYKILNTPRNGDLQNMLKLEREVRIAFQVWSDITPLKFRKLNQRSNEQADFEIAFKRGSHAGCENNDFDGTGGGRNILAHAYPRHYEGAKHNGIVHFDDDEKWYTDKTAADVNNGVCFNIIAAHEIGHSLGLLHSKDPDSLMYPAYSATMTTSEDDIRGIQELYGHNPRRGPHPTGYWKEKKTKGSGRTEAPHGAHCDLTFDAVIAAHNDKIYAFVGIGSDVYEIKENDGDPIKIRNPYNNPPLRVDAAVYHHVEQKTYLFSGSQYYRFTGFTLDSGYPKRLVQDFRNLDSAYMKGDRLYVYKGAKLSQWRTDLEHWRGQAAIPTHSSFIKDMDALVSRRGSSLVYSFKGTKMVRLSREPNVEGSSADKIDMRPVWLNCYKSIP